MLRFFAKRLLLTLPIFLALIALTFFALRLIPGAPIEVRRGERGISPERLAQLRHEMGLDQPLWKQYLNYLHDVVTLNFGTSLKFRSTVAELLAHVAAGRYDAFIEPHMNAWDALAGLLLIDEAGGRTLPYPGAGGLLSGGPVLAAAPGTYVHQPA